MNKNLKPPSMKKSGKEVKSSKSSSMKTSEKEVKSVKSLSLKRNPKSSFTRQEYDSHCNNFDYYSQNNSSHHFQNRRNRDNWNNCNYNAWYDRSYSSNYNYYNNRNMYYQRSNRGNYYYNQQMQCNPSESMENFELVEDEKVESVNQNIEDNKSESDQEHSKTSQDHYIYEEHSLNHDSSNKSCDKINNSNDSIKLVKKSSKDLLPIKTSQTAKCGKEISRKASLFSESNLKTNPASINSVQTKYIQRKKDSEKTGSEHNSLNSDNISLPSTGKNSSDGDKQWDKKTPSENMTDRISHWINPSSLKDKAEIDKLMTEYSKSRKKENLLRLKLHGGESKSEETDNCNDNIETRFLRWEHLQNSLSSINLDQEKNEPLELEKTSVSTDKVAINNGSGIPTVTNSPKVKKRKKSSLSESSLNSNQPVLSDSKSPVPRSSPLSRKPAVISKKGRRSRASIDSSFHTREELGLDINVESDYAAQRKRRNSLQPVNKSKKHKCSASECLEKCIHEEREKSQDGLIVPNPVENSLIYSEIYINPEELNLKKETFENLNQVTSSEVVSEQGPSEININNTQILDVEDLMKVFAAQNVKIKKEFDDPLIDAIQSMDVSLLLNVCDQQPSASKDKRTPLPNSIPQSQSPLCTSGEAISGCNQENKKSSNSGIFSNSDNSIEKSSSKSNDNLSDSELLLRSKNSIHEPSLSSCDLVEGISTNPDLLPDSRRNSVQNSDFFENIFPGLSPINVYVNISNELKKLQKEEEEKRANLKNIDKMIEKHQKILNNLNAAKIKLQTEEDNLISRRNSLTCALSHCISRDTLNTSADCDKSAVPSSIVKSTESLSLTSKNIINETNQVSTAIIAENTSINSQIDEPNPSSLTGEITSEDQCDEETLNQTDCLVEDNEEVIIIPKQDSVIEIPVIDLEEESPEKQRAASNKENENIASSEDIFELKDFVAHKTVVNSLKVLNHYLYSCANDYTAKRFNLKNLDEIVTYAHKKRNVLHLCVETYKDTTIVFTLCSLDKLISLFKADDGLPLKKYSFEFVATSITNGWGKIFAGLNNGQVVVCNSKETKDLVRNLEPVKSMACTFQGGLHILIILSINGQVAVRDVDRNGLLIRYIKAHSDTPLFMNVYNDCVYLSSSIVLTVSDLSNGSLKHKIKLTSPITGLAAHKNNIFTTSFSGLVRCYPNGQGEKMKMAYGVGNSVTSICVNQDWVFTANRNGEIGSFKFNPLPEFYCHFGNCQYVFSRLEDLKRHVFNGIDHQLFIKPSRKCPWKRCGQQFTKEWKSKDKKNHLEYHVNMLSKLTDLS